MIEFTPWPEHLAELYRQKGYWIDQPLTRILTVAKTQFPQSTAIICQDRMLSYAMLDQYSDHLASHLTEKGLGIGDTALVQLPNIAEFYIVFFALLKIGVVPLNALYSHRQHELKAFVQQIKPSLLIATRAHEVFKNDAFLEDLKNQEHKPRVCIMLNAYADDLDLNTFITCASQSEFEYESTPASEVAFFQLSGGSTGTPKLIPRTHNDYDYSVRESAEICQLNSQTRLLCSIPAAHNFMLSSPGALGVFHVGGCVVMAKHPEPALCFDLIEKHGVNMASLVPSAVILWLQYATEHSAKVRTLKLLQVGGASFPESIAAQVPSVLGCQLQQVFGMAEGLVNYTRLDDSELVILKTQGRPISPDDEVFVVNEQGKVLLDGEVGMLKVRGPYTFCGYYLSPDHNKDVFDEDGFYYSGDLVQRTDTGHFKVVGRVKDQINRGGEKIASEEIEKLLILHPDVTDAALVSFSDAHFGEKSCAFVVSRQPDMKAIQLKRHLLEIGIAQYKLPDQIHFIDSLPLTAVGKVNKKQLRQFFIDMA